MIVEGGGLGALGKLVGSGNGLKVVGEAEYMVDFVQPPLQEVTVSVEVVNSVLVYVVEL